MAALLTYGLAALLADFSAAGKCRGEGGMKGRKRERAKKGTERGRIRES